MTKSDEQLVQEFIAKRSQAGWLVVNQTPSTAQLRKPKTWSKGVLIFGFLLLIVYGAGLLLLIYAAIDYTAKQDQILYVTADQIRQGEFDKPPAVQNSGSGTIMLLIGLVVVVALIVYLFYF